MLPASNRGVGMSLNFPDVCKTPAPPLPFVPLPYPDLGMNMQAAPFSPFVQVGFMPATNMGTLKILTSGDEAGSMGGLITGLIKGPGKTTMGNPLILVSGLPGESLANPTSGNMMNAPVGVQVVPSISTVLYTLSLGTDGTDDADGEVAPIGALGEAGVAYLSNVARAEGECALAATPIARWLPGGVALVRLGLLSSHVDREVFVALDRLGALLRAPLILDLRGCPGGDGRAALRLAGAWLPRGTIMLLERDADGDDEPVPARGEPCHAGALVILVDGETASAAELVAATLQFHGRARVIGARTYGKATAQSAVIDRAGALQYATVAELRLPDGAPIHGRGVTPDVSITEPGDAALDAAIALLLADGPVPHG